MIEYRPDEPSTLPQTYTAIAYRQGRIDGLTGKTFDSVGTTIIELAAYRKGYEHGQSERRPKFPTKSVVFSVAVLVAVFIWWRIA